MSGLRGDDDGGRKPPDPDGLPGFPAEWGRIVIPDDCAELDKESTKVRRELRREAMFRRYGLLPRPHTATATGRMHHMALPLVLVVMAVLVTTTSLFAAMWPQGSRTGTAGDGTTNRPSTGTTPASLHTGAPLPDLTLTDSTGHTLHLDDARSTVVLLARHCACGSLITDTTRAAVAAGVSVLVVGDTRQPALPSLPGNATVATATDPSGSLASALDAGATPVPGQHTGGALLIDAKGTLVETVPATRSATDFAHQITTLT